jgi:hypothetical protein
MAKFKVGDRVIHRSKDKIGTVTLVFKDDEGRYRYYVDHSKFTWSVPESALLRHVISSTYEGEKHTNAPGASKRPNNIQTDQE